MKKKIRINNPGLQFLIQYWQRYCTLDDWHVEWTRNNILVRNKLRKGDPLYLEGEKQRNVYLVARGLLARVMYDEERENRKILSIATPGMALMTTSHLFSRTPSKGDIVVLRSGTLVIEVPYNHILQFKEQEPHLNTLISVLNYKKKKQISSLLDVMREQDPFARYLLFASHLPDLAIILTQIEQAQLLNISRKTVQRAQTFLLKGKRPLN